MNENDASGRILPFLVELPRVLDATHWRWCGSVLAVILPRRGCVRHLRPAGPPAYLPEHSMAVCNPQWKP